MNIQNLDINVISNYIKEHFLGILPAIILIILYKPIKSYSKKILSKIYHKTFKDNIGVISFLNSITRFIIDLVLIFTILNLLGINLSGIMAIFGALSLVFGFAFKDTLGNIFGGIIILVFKPFKVEDLIQFSGYEGKVTKIEIFYTYLLNYNNEEIIIPNGNIINSEIKNISRHYYRRLDLTIGVGYGSNIYHVKTILENIVNAKKDELFEIEINPLVIGMGEIGASSLNFDIKVHVKPSNYLKAKYYLNESIKTEFDKEGIELPYNIIDLQINKEFNDLNIKK